ncbi:MAG: TonB-dependent siderophore receptor [Pseudomonadota bacterium]|nr:TonB-dependent siderophore receptor [Pseudomonadota bacterium]
MFFVPPSRLTPLTLALIAAGLCASTAARLAHAETADDNGASALSTVVITATTEKKKLGDAVSAAALGRRANLDTPFSTRSVSSDEIEDRLATSIAEVMKYDASVTAISPPIGSHPATIAMRGLRLDDLNGYKIDGLANINRGTEMPLEMFESVEALKGLSGFMYGFGSPGGIINYVSKRPTTERSVSLDAGYQQGSALKEHIDTGGRFGQDEQFGYRLNALHEQGGLQQDDGDIKRNALGLNLDWRIHRDLALTFDTLYQKRRSVGGTDIIADIKYSIPEPLSGKDALNSLGAFSEVEYYLSTLGLEYRLAPDWKASLSYRYSDSTRVYKKDQYYLQDSAGRYRDRVTSESHAYTFHQAQATLEGKLTTGVIDHQLIFGAMSQELVSTSSVVTPKTYIGYGNLAAPTIYSASTVNYSGGTYEDEKTTQDALFVSDTLVFSPQWSALTGLRYTKFKDTAYTTANKVSADYPANKATPTVALMFKPRPDTTLYVSHVEALEQAASAPGSTLNPLNQTFAPIKSRQSEIGVKSEHRLWNATAALFRIDRGAQYTNAANYFVMDGQTRYQGLELNSVVQASKNVSVEGGIMLLDATLENAAAAYTGKRAVGAPKRQASMQVTWRPEMLAGLALHAGTQYLGALALDAGNVHTLPSYALFDAGLNYRARMAGHMVSLRLNVTNLAGRKYWTYYQENYLNAGAPRTASLNVRVDF